MITAMLIIGLAAWRITALISYERGPFDIFARFRSLLGIDHDPNPPNEPISWPNNSLARAITCPWCLGLWMAVACWGLWEWEPTVVMVIAASTVLVAVERWNHG